MTAEEAKEVVHELVLMATCEDADLRQAARDILDRLFLLQTTKRRKDHV